MSIESELKAALGHEVLVNTEYGLSVWDASTMTSLLTESKAPSELSAHWILERITKKNASNARLKTARDIGIAAMKRGLAEKGICGGANCYATSFGFSVCNLFQDGMKAAREIIEKGNIQFKRIEFSEMHFVVRVFL